jgi:predicted CoA-binding protein
VVGASSDVRRPSFEAVRYFAAEGYRVYPVNPLEEKVAGLPALPALSQIPEPVDLVDVFRRSEHTPDVARQAAGAGARYVWLQVGITSEEARSIAEDAGIGYVEDRCAYTIHRVLRRVGALPDAVAVVKNLSRDERIEWAGVYWVDGERLVLGPYAGPHPTGRERLGFDDPAFGSAAVTGQVDVLSSAAAAPILSRAGLTGIVAVETRTGKISEETVEAVKRGAERLAGRGG